MPGAADTTRWRAHPSCPRGQVVGAHASETWGASELAGVTLAGPMTLLAALLYLVNCLVGVAAQFTGVGFGRWHHALYALVFASSVAALVVNFHPGLCVTVAALAMFPRARPRTPWHPLLAVIGLLGHVVTLLSRA